MDDRSGPLRPHREPVVFEPSDFVAHLDSRGLLPDLPVPAAAILCYQRSLVRHAQANRGALPAGGAFSGLYVLPGDAPAITSGYGIGAPAAASTMEELIALGCRRFVSIGIAGCLQRGMTVGDLVLCTSALCDEGTSPRYGDVDRFTRPSAPLTRRLAAALETVAGPAETGAEGLDVTLGAGQVPPAGAPPRPRLFRGPTWTVDAVYRETVETARALQAEGVLTVEMETSALFTVAAYRGVEVAAAFTVSDSLADLTWAPDFDNPAIARGLELLLEAAATALREQVA
jgi:uridine phosphorylase